MNKSVYLLLAITIIFTSCQREVINQTDLAKLAIVGDSIQIRIEALNKITEEFLITKIAYISTDSIVSSKAFQSIKHPYIAKMHEAIKSVPNSAQNHILKAILPVLHILSYQEVINKVGKISSIGIKWKPREQSYRASYGSVTSHGEDIICNIEFENDSCLTSSWVTQFPESYTVVNSSSSLFFTANINPVDLIYKITGSLPESVVRQIAKDVKQYYEFEVDWHHIKLGKREISMDSGDYSYCKIYGYLLNQILKRTNDPVVKDSLQVEINNYVQNSTYLLAWDEMNAN